MDVPRITPEAYSLMIAAGVIEEDEPIELLEGYLVLHPERSPGEDCAAGLGYDELRRLLPAGWMIRPRCGIGLSTSVPEPDLSVTRGADRAFVARRPGPADLGLVVEISDALLARDERDKARIYARDSIPVYWVVNLVDRRVEVFTDPTGPDVPAGAADPDPHYRSRRDYPADTAVPVVLDGVAVGVIPVDELLP